MTKEEIYRKALQDIYTIALGGSWKSDRRIRRTCIDALGERECAILKAEKEIGTKGTEK